MIVHDPIVLDRALMAAEQAIREARIKHGMTVNAGTLAYAALRAAIPILDREAA